MAQIDLKYKTLLETILQQGYKYEDPKRKGTYRLEIPNYTFRHEFKDGFPAITTKKLNYKAVVTELIWFLRGDTNIKYLVDNGCNIWNKDAYNYYVKQCKIENWIPYLQYDKWLEEVKKEPQDWYESGLKHRNCGGNLGPIYGRQWRNFNGVDQIERLIKNLKEQPLATDHIVNSWNVGDLDQMALPPCHYGFQIVVRPLNYIERYKLWFNNNYETGMEYNPDITPDFDNSYYDPTPEYGFELHWQQRSCDLFLGIPFNVASYATLALIIEKLTGYKALAIQGDLKKVHLYDNSIDAVKEQLSRNVDKYNKCEFTIGTTNGTYNNLKLFKENNLQLNTLINNLYIDDFKLINYESYPFIKVEMLKRDE